LHVKSTRLPGRRITTAGSITKTKSPTVWKEGQSGNPAGRPKDARSITVLKNDLEIAVREQLSPRRVSGVVNRLIKIAMESLDEQAAIAAGKTILGMAISKPHIQEQAATKGGFTIVIENATLQALAQQKPEQKPIEASYVECSESNQ
jgi:hypothetical protein